MQETLKAESCATQLIVGAGVSITGKFVVPGRAIIHGSVDGELDADELLIGPGGVVSGNIVARTADVAGACKRSLMVREFVVIRSTGKVSDRVSCGEVEVERGGVINGVFSQGALAAEPPKWGDTQPPTQTDKGLSD